MSNTIPRYPHIVVQLTGEDGNAFAIIGRVRKGLQRAKVPPCQLADFIREAMSGDYDKVLQTCDEWVTVL